MIERQFVLQKIKKQQIQEYMAKMLAKAGYSHTDIQRTPLGEKVIVYTTRPGLVVGKKGENIKKLTAYLKSKFKLENPQIEIGEIENPLLDVQYVSDRIAYSLERFGPKRFKSIGYRALQDIMNAGAIGAEILVSGKIPSARARAWRFSAGYLKKSGSIAQYDIKKAVNKVNLRPGTVGIKVSIMTPDIELPDKIVLPSEKEAEIQVEEVKVEENKEVKQVEVKEKEATEVKKEEKTEVKKEEVKKEKKKAEPKKETKKKTAKKETKKKVVKKETKEKTK